MSGVVVGSGPEGRAGCAGVQCPIAACSGVQLAAGGTGAGAGGAGGIVQCPIAACSGVQVDAGGAGGEGVGGMAQCPIAACSGVQVEDPGALFRLRSNALEADGQSISFDQGRDRSGIDGCSPYFGRVPP